MTEVLLIGSAKASLPAVAELAHQLKAAGLVVRFAMPAEPGETSPVAIGVKGVETHRLRMSLSVRRNGAPLPRLSPAWCRVVVRNAVVRVWSRTADPARRTWLVTRYDPWLRKVARSAAYVVAVDRNAQSAARLVVERNPQAILLRAGEPALDTFLDRIEVTRPLRRMLAGARSGSVDPGSVARAWKEVEHDPADPYLHQFVAGAVTIVDALRRRSLWDVALTVAESALDQDLPAELADQLRLQAAIVRLSCGEQVPNLSEHVRAVLRHADARLAAGQPAVAASMMVAVTDAMFHRELHADVLHSTLVDDPDEFLAPLRASRAFTALSAPRGALDATTAVATTAATAGAAAHGAPAQHSPRRQPHERHRLLVVPGDYPHFTRGIIATLADDPGIDLRVFDLRAPGAPPRRRDQVSMLTDRYAEAFGRPVPPLAEVDRDLLAWADTIFVDWCDNTAAWVALHAPRSARLVIRLHSLEAISAQPHMIDWSRVSDLIFVGQHVRQLVERAVPAVAAAGRIHVVPNMMRLDRFGLDKHPGAERTLAMVGWAQRVKDPLWVLEVLARLRAHDRRWRLLLLGHDFSERQHVSALRYRDRFRARAREDDVRAGVTYCGYIEDLPEALRDAGFIVSASRREGFPVGVTEGAASAAVPVIRDWPLYAAYDGARSVFPADWVVTSVDEAVARVLSHADLDKWAAAGGAAREYVVERYDWSVVGPRFREILLGTVGQRTAAR